MWQTLLVSVVGTLASNGLMALAANKWIEHKYEMALAEHKAKLDRENEKELTQFKHDLELAAAGRNLRFSITFEKTALVIAETYDKLLSLNQAVVDYTMNVDSAEQTKRSELRKEYESKADALYVYVLPNIIYIPKDIGDKILVAARTMKASAIQYSIALNSKDLPRESGKLFECYFQTIDKIPQLMDVLREDFQRILGFPSECKTENKPGS